MRVTFQGGTVIITSTSLKALRLHETSYRLVNRGAGAKFWATSWDQMTRRSHREIQIIFMEFMKWFMIESVIPCCAQFWEHFVHWNFCHMYIFLNILWSAKPIFIWGYADVDIFILCYVNHGYTLKCSFNKCYQKHHKNISMLLWQW